MSNEAAERLRGYMLDETWEHGATMLDEALEAERRATVERIRGTILAKRAMYFSQTDSANTLNDILRHLDAILDEEAAR